MKALLERLPCAVCGERAVIVMYVLNNAGQWDRVCEACRGTLFGWAIWGAASDGVFEEVECSASDVSDE